MNNRSSSTFRLYNIVEELRRITSSVPKFVYQGQNNSYSDSIGIVYDACVEYGGKFLWISVRSNLRYDDFFVMYVTDQPVSSTEEAEDGELVGEEVGDNRGLHLEGPEDCIFGKESKRIEKLLGNGAARSIKKLIKSDWSKVYSVYTQSNNMY